MTTPSSQGRIDEAEIQRLFERIDDDASARDKLVLAFQPLAEYFARRFSGRGEPLEDLTQVANIGLISAIDRFDPSRGVRFATFAAATIVGELKRHLRDKAWAIKVPRRVQELGLHMNRAVPRLSQELGRSPTIQEIAERLESTPEEILEAMDGLRAYATVSVELPTGEDGRSPIEAAGENDPSFELVERWTAIAPGIKSLPDRERRILYLRFFSGMTQSEIAGEMGISQMHVSRILAHTLEHLREEVREEP